MPSIYDTHKPESSSGARLKLEDGQTVTIRIVSEPVIYTATNQDDSISTRYGWIVWNQDEQKAQVLEQSATFFRNLAVLAKNKSWGDPTNTYDIDITREGTGLDTRYSLTPSPNRNELTGAAAAAINEIDIIEMIGSSKFNSSVLWLSEFDKPYPSNSMPGAKAAPRTTAADLADEPINLDDIPF